MNGARLAHATTLAMVLVGCGGGGAADPGQGGSEPEPPACQDRGLMTPGGCIDPGIGPDGCGEGFRHDGDRGCEAVLPPEPCPSGRMAVPGDEACREVTACGDGAWPDVEGEAAVHYVDASYQGGDGDGTQAKPWTSVADAVQAVPSGGVVAVTGGSYAGNIILGKPVRILGVCPAETEIVTTPGGVGVAVGPGADGTVVRGLSITGGGFGIAASGVSGVRLEALHLHDLDAQGINLHDQAGPASVTVIDSLVERVVGAGATAFGSELVVERSHLRGVLDAAGVGPGAGVAGTDGYFDPIPSSIAVTGSLIEETVTGVLGKGASVVVTDTAIRDNWPDQQGLWGEGLRAEDDGSDVPSLIVRGAQIERVLGIGVVGLGADVTVDRVTVQDVRPPVANPPGGLLLLIASGVLVQDALDTGSPASLTMERSLVGGMTGFGVLVQGGDAVVSESVIRDIGDSGNGVARAMRVQVNNFTGRAASATVADSLVERAHSVGVDVDDAALTLERSVVRDVSSLQDGRLGDGVAVVDRMGTASSAVIDSRIEGSARAGMASFGAEVTLSNVSLFCQPIHLNGESFEGRPPIVDDAGDNRCGCGEDVEACKLLSTDIAPPPPIE